MSPELDQLALGLAAALGMGALIGLERERWSRTTRTRTFGGARTYPLIALAGGVSAILGQAVSFWALLVGFSAFAGLLLVGYRAERRDGGDEADLGLTSEVAAMLVFAISTLPFLEAMPLPFAQRVLLMAGIGAVVLAILSVRERAHEFAERLSAEDVRATVQFVLLALVALPLLPREAIGPFDFFNPFGTGVVVVLIAGVSYLGYLAVRLLGPRRGIGLTALFGGLVSSTAVTLTFSSRGKQVPRLAAACSFAIVLASTIMFPRIAVEVGVIRPPLLRPTLLPLAAMVVAGLIGCIVLWLRSGEEAKPHEEGEPPRLSNPFSLPQALKLGAVYVAVRFIAAAAYAWLGQAGLLATAAVSGLTDVDAITLSVARMHGGGLDERTAVVAIAVAAASNTLAKSMLAFVLGGRRIGLLVASVLVPAGLAGLIVAWFLA